MSTQGQIGGTRDIGAQRAACTAMAAAIDAMVRTCNGFAAAFKDYGQAGFTDIGNNTDDAYWLAVKVQDMPGLMASAQVQELIEIANKCRDLTRTF